MCLYAFSKLLYILLIINHVSCLPIQPHRELEKDLDRVDEHGPEYDVVYVPYDFKYAPVKIPIDSETSDKKILKHAFIENMSKTNTEKVEPSGFNRQQDKTKTNSNNKDLLSLPVSGIQETDFSEKHKIISLNDILKTDNKDLVLVPLSTLTKLNHDTLNIAQEDDSLKVTGEDIVLIPVSSIRKPHSIMTPESSEEKTSVPSQKVKRQAPRNNFVLRPVVRFGRVLRSSRRVSKPPPLVGYLRDGDFFPTVA